MTDRQAELERYICRFIHGTPGALYDIGVGSKSEWKTLGQEYPAMQVCGCEPDRRTYARLIAAGFPGPLLPVALGEVERTATLYCCPRTNASLFPDVDGVEAAETQQVEVWTLDHFDKAMGQPDRIILWMDIEGSEESALRSGPELLQSGRVHWINLEVRRQGHREIADWAEPKAIDRLLKGYGYARVAVYAQCLTHQDVIYALDRQS